MDLSQTNACSHLRAPWDGKCSYATETFKPNFPNPPPPLRHAPLKYNGPYRFQIYKGTRAILRAAIWLSD